MASNDVPPVPVSPTAEYLPRPVRLVHIGFCGLDDSVSPNHVGAVLSSYPFVEFGILFRPECEGSPRYASKDHVGRICDVVQAVRVHQKNKANAEAVKISLAAHLCGSRVNEVLSGDGAFISKLQFWGFNRVQINATAVNGVDTSSLGSDAVVKNCINIIGKYHKLQFIIQKNEETKPLWTNLLLNRMTSEGGRKLKNMSMLLDESKGSGEVSRAYPPPPADYDLGYAGGIGPENISEVLEKVSEAAGGRTTWIDMESSLRTKSTDGCDIFDMNKCFAVIDAVVKGGFHNHPDYYLSGSGEQKDEVPKRKNQSVTDEEVVVAKRQKK